MILDNYPVVNMFTKVEMFPKLKNGAKVVVAVNIDSEAEF